MKHQHTAQAPWRNASWGRNECEERAPTAKEIRAAARGFKTRTGVGVDAISPGALAWLSDPLLEAIGKYMLLIESEGTWPQQVQEALLH